MKKFALLPALALLILGACSDNKGEEPNPVPTDPVVSVNPVPDQTTLNVPEQDPEYIYDSQAGSACYRFKYANGQELTLDIDTRYADPAAAVVRKIEGTASEVVIPPYCTAKLNNVETQIPIVSINLYQDGVAECVKTVKIAQSVNKMFKDNKYLNVTDEYICNQVKKMASVERIELEDGFGGGNYGCINGAVYSNNFRNLVAVPNAVKGVFTVADGTQTIGVKSFFDCREITGITLPASVAKINANAVVGTSKLGLINMLSTEAPEALEDSFGHYAYDGVLRIPAGCKADYTFEKPDMELPVEPASPDIDASDEEWDAYDEAYAIYEEELKAYNEAFASYNTHSAYRNFKNVEEVNF